MLLKTIRYLYYSLFIITPLLMSSKTSEMFEFNKMIFIYFISAFVFCLWCIYYIVRQPQLYLPKKICIPLFIFVLVLVVSTFQSIDRFTSIFGYYGRWNGGFISIVSYIVLFFVFLQVFTKDNVHTLLKISLITSTVVMAWGFFAKFGLDLSCYIFINVMSNTCWTTQFQPAIRMFSTLGQPNWLGSYLAIHFFIALYYFINSYPLLKDHETVVDKIKHILAKFHVMKEPHPFGPHLFYGAYLVVNVIAVYFTKSRSSLLALGVSGLIGILLFFTRGIPIKYRFVSRVTMIVFVFVTVGYFINIQSNLFRKQPLDNVEITDSYEIRKIVWKGAVDLGKMYPWFGSGPETFAYAYFFTKPAEHNRTSEWDFIYNKAHNEYLNYFATTGYIGLFSYLVVIGATLYIAYYFKNRYRIYSGVVTMITLGYTTILITNFFGFSTSTVQLFFFLIPGMILVLDQKQLEDVSIQNFMTTSHKQRTAIMGFLVLFIVTAVYLYNYHRADRLYKQAKDQIYQENYKQAVLLLTHALRLKYDHVFEDQLSSALAHLAFISSFDQDQDLSSNLIKLSKDANSHTLRTSPVNILYWKTRAKNYYLYYQVTHDTQDLKRAAESTEHVIRLAPSDAQSYYMLGLFYTFLYREVDVKEYNQKAIETIKQSLELRPNFIEARELMERMLSK